MVGRSSVRKPQRIYEPAANPALTVQGVSIAAMNSRWQPPRTGRSGAPSWTRSDAYVGTGGGQSTRGFAVAVIAGAVVIGLGTGAWLSLSEAPPAAVPAARAEEKAEQSAPPAVETITPQVEADPVDAEWAARGEISRAGPSTSPGRTQSGVRGAFGYCHSGGRTNCVIDGDTFRIGGQKVRIAGIDAPETHPPRCAREAELGAAATRQLQALLNSGAVTMTGIGRDRDRYGRLLRNVAVDGQDVGAAMIAAGVAREYGRGRRSWCG